MIFVPYRYVVLKTKNQFRRLPIFAGLAINEQRPREESLMNQELPRCVAQFCKWFINLVRRVFLGRPLFDIVGCFFAVAHHCFHRVFRLIAQVTTFLLSFFSRITLSFAKDVTNTIQLIHGDPAPSSALFLVSNQLFLPSSTRSSSISDDLRVAFINRFRVSEPACGASR